MRALLLAALALLPGMAHADPISIVVALAPYIGGTAAAFIASNLTTIAFLAVSGYSTVRARSKARARAAAAKAAYNASLQDRNITALSADPAHRVIYGRCETGGDVVAMFTTDKNAVDEHGSAYTKPDGYKHLVVVWSARECAAIHDIKIDGVSLGALDGAGWATASEWGRASASNAQSSQRVAGHLRSTTIPAGAAVLAVSWLGAEVGSVEAIPAGGSYGWSLSGTTVTLPNLINGGLYSPGASDQWEISYTATDTSAGSSTVRALHHLGSTSQAADATLMSLVPGQWTANHRLRGRCYSVITLDLERQQFQGGPPGITAEISGALVLDRRTGATGWSANPALIVDDWLRSPLGYSVALADVDAASVIAAANACDVSTSFTVGATTTTGPCYTANGIVRSDQPREAVLQDLCESMAGWASYGGNWRMLAGAWVPPVMDLVDDDLAGSIEIVQAGEPSGELINSLRGQYVPAGSAVAADIEPFANATFVAADGRSLWGDVDLPFTNTKARAKNLARIQVETSRNGLVISYPAKLKAWPLQTGDRVRITSAEYGFAAKTFRVTDWQFGLKSPVMLTLQEDDAAAYDLADAAAADPTPNTGLASPWVVPALISLSAASGSAELQRQADGTITARVRLSWPRSTAPYMEGGGRIEITWRAAGSDTWATFAADGTDAGAYLGAVRDGDVLIIGATVVNSLGARSVTTWAAHTVLGKSQPPTTPTGFGAAAATGGARLYWDGINDLDYAESRIYEGATYAGAALIWRGAATELLWVKAPATYQLWLVHADTSGNLSTPLGLEVIINPGSVTGLTVQYSVNGASGWHSTWVVGDLYLRQSFDGGTTWSGAIRFVGSDGATGSPGANGSDGSPGANGTRTADAKVYKWGLSIPAAPTGTSTYTWATASLDAAPSGWTLTTGTAVPGFTLWAATVRLSNNATTATDTISWSGAGVSAIGGAGQAGLSSKIAYAVVTSGSTPSAGTRTSTGTSSLPASNSWGMGEAWVATVPAYGANQTVYQTLGSYNPATDVITWDQPFVSTLKVGSLSAISANLGTITAGDIYGVNITGATVTGGVLQTASSGQRIAMNEAGNNLIKLYGNAGGGLESLAQIGYQGIGFEGQKTVAVLGSNTIGNNAYAVVGLSYAQDAVYGASTLKSGLVGICTTPAGQSGVVGETYGTGAGVWAIGRNGAPGVYAYATSGPAVKSVGGIGVDMGVGYDDPYGTISVTRPASGSPSYYGLTRNGVLGMGMGIDSSARFFIGTTTAGYTSSLSSAWMYLSPAGLQVQSAFGCNGVSPPARASVNGPATDAGSTQALANQLRAALIACGICA